MMCGESLKLLCFVIVLCTKPTTIFGVNIKFYEGKNNTGFFHEVTSVHAGCNEVDSKYSPVEGSLLTDTCLMVFNGEGCSSYSGKVLSGKQNIDTNFITVATSYEKYIKSWQKTGEKGSFGVKSFRPCNKTEGGTQLNVDIYNTGDPKVEFKDLCGCRNLPAKLQKQTNIIWADNHGNPFKVYTKMDCGGESRIVPAGFNKVSEDLTNFSGDDEKPVRKVIMSIGPNSNSLTLSNCVRLTSTISKFEFLEDGNSKVETTNQSTVEMAHNTVFRNNGAAKISQEYKATKMVTETAEVEVASMLGSMHKSTVENKMEISGGAGIPLLSQAKFKNELTLAYEYEKKTEDTTTKKSIITTTREFSVRQLIEVPGCTNYSVSSSVLVVKDKPLEYKVYSKITGELGGKKMTAADIKNHIDPGLQIVKEVDKNTLLVSAKAVMKVEYGVKSVVDGHGTKIPNCKEKRGSIPN